MPVTQVAVCAFQGYMHMLLFQTGAPVYRDRNNQLHRSLFSRRAIGAEMRMAQPNMASLGTSDPGHSYLMRQARLRKLLVIVSCLYSKLGGKPIEQSEKCIGRGHTLVRSLQQSNDNGINDDRSYLSPAAMPIWQKEVRSERTGFPSSDNHM
ncbi:hypothetical protein BJX63DRAFT_404930 [Aspergillus granulosus]|uniref:Uncharacterized protein n=1 Tax=Aspergillus granulosus TaxID=176169 RepID=A0ABR4H2I5_9EURO